MLAPQVIAMNVFSLHRVIRAVLLDRCHAERTGRLENASRVLEHILDRCTRGIGVHDDEFVDDLARQAKRLLADQLDCGSVGKEADIRELNPLARVDRAQHRVGVGHLDTDDSNLGSYGLDVGADPRDQVRHRRWRRRRRRSALDAGGGSPSRSFPVRR
jgi:hypothetical protein